MQQKYKKEYKEYIVVPVDGTTNIKLEVLELDTLTCVQSFISNTPTKVIDKRNYDATLDEFEWFDSCISKLPPEIKNNIVIISPVARGASGGIINANNEIIDADTLRHTLAYTYIYPEIVEQKFRELVGSAQQFYQETGSILHFPGSLTLIKRLLFESLQRPEVLKKAKGFATYNILMLGHFLNGDYLGAIEKAGNEHTYWMSHTGARNIKQGPGTPSEISYKIPRLHELIPKTPTFSYQFLTSIAEAKAKVLGISTKAQVTPGGHDTSVSHIPVMRSFNQYFTNKSNKPLIHVDAGTWAMCARIDDSFVLPPLGYKQGILVQGTVDGKPVVTSIYGGGNDFKYIKRQVEAKGMKFVSQQFNSSLLEEVVTKKNCFILPNINPINYNTGPFPTLKGEILNQDNFFGAKPGMQHIIACLTIAFTIACQINLIAGEDASIPIILTAGGAKDVYLGRLLSCIAGRKVYLMRDSKENILSETTTLGAAMVGKAALLGIHPYDIDLSTANIQYKFLSILPDELKEKVMEYAKSLLELIQKEVKQEITFSPLVVDKKKTPHFDGGLNLSR